jgi:hypothetical protein
MNGAVRHSVLRLALIAAGALFLLSGALDLPIEVKPAHSNWAIAG